MMKSVYFRVVFCLLVVALVLTPGVSANNIASDAHAAWLASVHESWAEQDNEFKNSPTSPLAGAARYEIAETEPVYFAEKDGELGWSLESGDQSKFSLLLTEDGWEWTDLSAEVTGMREDENISSGSALLAGDFLQVGRFSVAVYPGESQITALVFDANSQQLKDFTALERFEASDRFAVTANIVRFESPEKVDLVTGLQRIKERYKYAILEFEIDGAGHELTAYKYALEGENSDVLFVPFTDKTSGKYSYGGGRYLSVEEPGEGAEVLIDFNLVTNPLCAYTAIYNCIVPTPENRLPIAIRAGEKKYH